MSACLAVRLSSPRRRRTPATANRTIGHVVIHHQTARVLPNDEVGSPAANLDLVEESAIALLADQVHALPYWRDRGEAPKIRIAAHVLLSPRGLGRRAETVEGSLHRPLGSRQRVGEEVRAAMGGWAGTAAGQDEEGGESKQAQLPASGSIH